MDCARVDKQMGSASASPHNDPDAYVDLVPRVLPGIIPLRKISSGGFGTVWLAEDAIGRKVALKVFDPNCVAGDRERDALRCYCPNSNTSYPNLLVVYHISAAGATPFCYTMELADNFSASPGSHTTENYLADSLEQRIRCYGRLKLAEIIRITRGIIRGLSHLHECGIAHHDIKPANILFVGNEVRIGDLSILGQIGDRGHGGGTGGYLPPPEFGGELAGGGDPQDADLYALGKTVYRMMTGMGANDFGSIPEDVLRDARLRRLNGFINHACATRRSDRFDDIAALSSDFERKVAAPFEGTVHSSAVSRLVHRLRPRYVNAAVGLGIAAVVAVASNYYWSRNRQHPAQFVAVDADVPSSLGADAMCIFSDAVSAGVAPRPEWDFAGGTASFALPANDAGGLRQMQLRLPSITLKDSFEIYFEVVSELPKATLQCTFTAVADGDGRAELTREMKISQPPSLRDYTASETAAVSSMPAMGIRLIGIGGQLLWWFNGMEYLDAELPGKGRPTVFSLRISGHGNGALWLRNIRIFCNSPDKALREMEDWR